MPVTRRQFGSTAAGLAAFALALATTGCGGGAADDPNTITVYSADGLRSANGDGFYNKVFKDFEKKTGISVNYVEGGSGEIVQRLTRERHNTQADVLVTLPPFIQQAQGRELLAEYRPKSSEQFAAGDRAKDGTWTSVVNNYFCFIYNKEKLDSPPKTWKDLLDPKFQGKLQYSTPGVAGDGTAVLIKAMHDFGGQRAAMDYLGRLQKNNVGPSSSTGALAPKVNKGELLVANGDVQMNYANTRSMPNQGIFVPAKEGEKPTTFALPYAAGVVKGAPHQKNAQRFLDHLLSAKAQEQVTSTGGGFPARTDVEPTGEEAEDLERIMADVEVFTPDWNRVEQNLDSYVDAWKEATGS